MKKQPRGAESAKPESIFPVVQVSVGDLIDRMDDMEIETLLNDQLGEALEAYLSAYATFRATMKSPESYRLKPLERLFRGVQEHDHPMYRGRWAHANGGGGHVQAQLERALKAKDWQEVIVLAGMHCVREMLYGRPAERAPAPKPAAKRKAPAKGAQKKPAAKKPATTSKVATLKDLVEQARPLFRKNPSLSRAELIKAIGRRYERLTTLDELRTLCAGKTPTAHSLKKKDTDTAATTPRQAATPPASPSQAKPWPFATDEREQVDALAKQPKPKRARRDPAAPAPSAAPKADPAPAPRTTWPVPNTEGDYREEDADHRAEFRSAFVTARFCALETESGWTTGCLLKVQYGPASHEAVTLEGPLNIHGPLAPDADTAIRDVVGDMLAEVKKHLKAAEAPSNDIERKIAVETPNLEKLRAWLLGFQVRGVEKIAFLKKGGQMELAA